MADLPVPLSAPLAAQLAAALDVEGKIPRAVEALGPVAGADVLLVDGGERIAGIVRELGGRVAVVAPDALASVAPGSADVLLACWSWFRDDLPGCLAAAERAVRPGGRILVLHDYGRDDVSRLRPADLPEYASFSRRDGWFLRNGFKVRVIHCFWTFGSVEAAAAFLGEAFGADGAALGSGLRRPRLSYNVAIYHRTPGDPASA